MQEAAAGAGTMKEEDQKELFATWEGWIGIEKKTRRRMPRESHEVMLAAMGIMPVCQTKN